ncbi:MAG TPA: septal ring lytic transglycosylase RlpA family protein [Solirubrobacteraceae bacterium]|nr:septal ring lytic transglycosylase RlpA family protein [Solirubrobacteraceae bacterium]
MPSFKHTVSLVVAVLAGPAASLAVLPSPAAWAGTGGAQARKAGATTPTTTATGSEAEATTGGASTGDSGTGAGPAGRSGKTVATWYGPGFYGHRTACGQKMSPTLVGVASRTLACGTLVRFGFRGHQLTVPVLDRGPYGGLGATWDLTAGAARALEIRETVKVTARVVGSVPNSTALGEAPEASPLGEPVTSGTTAPTGETSAKGGAGAAAGGAGAAAGGAGTATSGAAAGATTGTGAPGAG